MHLLTTTRDALLAPLQSVAGIVEKRHTLPILSNVLIEKQGDQLTMLATDIEIQIRTTSAGAATANHCTSWTFDTDNSAAGTSGCDNSLAEWTSCTISDLSCDSNAHLYCFEQ